MATFTKLRDGSWGIKVSGDDKRRLDSGNTKFAVTKKGGGSSAVTVTKTLTSGSDYAVCAIEQKRSSGTSHGGKCCECRGPLVNARHHRAMGDLCGSCAFDEYDC